MMSVRHVGLWVAHSETALEVSGIQFRGGLGCRPVSTGKRVATGATETILCCLKCAQIRELASCVIMTQKDRCEHRQDRKVSGTSTFDSIFFILMFFCRISCSLACDKAPPLIITLNHKYNVMLVKRQEPSDSAQQVIDWPIT